MINECPLVKSTVTKNGGDLENDVDRCRKLIVTVKEMTRVDSETDLNEMRGTIETILEMAEEGLMAVIENHENDVYDQAPTEEPTEEHRA